MDLEKVRLTDILNFRCIVEAYWQEVMPHSKVHEDIAARRKSGPMILVP
jgi:hypothetical protein